jgi:hypothetical protein
VFSIDSGLGSRFGSVSSVESLGYSNSVGQTSNYHTDLLGPEEYSISREFLTR